MRASVLLLIALALLPSAVLSSASAETPIPIVAAENFYGDVAQQIGGPEVAVTSVLSNPDQDPHLFETSPAVARAVAAARIVVYNGIDYDPWMEKQVQATHSNERTAIDVAALMGKKTGDNPHIWYDPATMPAFAERLAALLTGLDPAHRADFATRLAKFRSSLQPVAFLTIQLRERLDGTPAAATEPVFGYMLSALGMTVSDPHFQLAVMNNTEPSASDVAQLEGDLQNRRVKLLIYNSQATDAIAQHMVDIARGSHVPVVGVTETEPPGKNFQKWIADELNAVDRALPAKP